MVDDQTLLVGKNIRDAKNERASPTDGVHL